MMTSPALNATVCMNALPRLLTRKPAMIAAKVIDSPGGRQDPRKPGRQARRCGSVGFPSLPIDQGRQDRPARREPRRRNLELDRRHFTTLLLGAAATVGV